MIKKILLLSLVAVLAYTFVMAQNPGRMPGFGPPPGGPGLPFRELNLTDAQQQQIKAIFEQENQSTADLRNQLKTQSEALRQLETAATFDSAAYKAAAVALGNTQAELMTTRATAFNQIYNQVLTQDQRDKLKQMEANHPQGPPPGGGFGPGRPE
jgi:Spy/CpxP family protein refolding chaperone